VKFVLFVEGKTEQMAVPPFLKRWLDARLSSRVGVKTVRFQGWPEFDREIVTKVHLNLDARSSTDVIAGIGLLDLYGPTFYPPGVTSAGERIKWAVRRFEKKVEHPRLRMFFAVHEVEAWLLSQPSVFPKEIETAFPGMIAQPETVDFDVPPARLLEKLYRDKLSKRYKKVTYGTSLFGKLDPDVAYGECPNLRTMLDAMLGLAKSAGL
jgi:hypothetical protein